MSSLCEHCTNSAQLFMEQAGTCSTPWRPLSAAAALAVPATGCPRSRWRWGATAVRDTTGAILFVPPDRKFCTGDLPVIDPCAAGCSREAAREYESAARSADGLKRAAYRVTRMFTTSSHECYGRLGRSWNMLAYLLIFQIPMATSDRYFCQKEARRCHVQGGCKYSA